MSTTDSVLFDKWKRVKDPDAFTDLFARHSSMVYGACYRILWNEGAAEEVAQECFVELLRSTASVDSVGGWLHTIATRRALDRLKADTRRRQREARYGAAAGTVLEPAWDDLRGYVDEAIEELPEQLRAPIVLRFLEGRPHRVIARDLSVSRSTVRIRIKKGIASIRDSLSKRGLEIAVAALSGAFAAMPVEAVPPTLIAEMGRRALAAAGGPAVAAVSPTGKTAAAGAAGAGTYGVSTWFKVVAGGFVFLAVLVTTYLVVRTQAPTLSRAEFSNVAPITKVETVAEAVPPVVELEDAAEPAHADRTVSGPDSVPDLSAVREEHRGVVHGIVVYEGGEIAADVPVRLREDFQFDKRLSEAYPPVALDQTTDEFGRFRFENLPMGQATRFFDTRIFYAVLAQTDGWSEVKYGSPHQKESHSYLKLILKRSRAHSGRVVDGFGNPVPGAKIFRAATSDYSPGRVDDQYSFFTTSDDRGEFVLSIPADKMNRIRVEADGYETLSHTVDPGWSLPDEFVLSYGHSLSGVLMDALDRAPLAGVGVSLWGTDFRRVTWTVESDEQGRVRFDSLANGDYRLVLDDDEWTTLEGEQIFTIHDGDLVDRDLLAEVGGIVQGRVTDRDTGRGVPGVSVRTMSARGMSGVRSVTDDDGYYKLTGLAGEVRILNSGAPGYPKYGVYRWDTLQEIVVESGNQYSDVDFSLAKGDLLSGRVIDGNGAPVANALVFASQAGMGGMRDDVLTDALGRFTLCNYQKTRDIFLFARTHNQASKPLGPFNAGSPELDNPEIILYDGATVEGVVVDGLGRAVKSAGVMSRWQQEDDQRFGYMPGAPSSRTIEDGSFRLSPLPPGAFDLWLLPPGTSFYLSESFARFRVAAGEVKTGVRVVYDEGDGLELSGIVLSRQGEPLKNVQIQVNGPLYTETKSDDQGRFRVARLPDGEYTISAYGMGLSSYREANIPAGTTGIQIVLESSARIVGTVVDAETAQPVDDFEVHVASGNHRQYIWGSDYTFKEFSGSGGRFELNDVSAGENTVVVRAPGYVTQFQAIEDVPPGDPVIELTIALSRGAVIGGTVLDPDGKPADGALLFIGSEPKVYRWNWQAIAATTTRASGAFRIDSLPADATMITAYLEGFAPTTRLIPSGDTMTITLARGSTLEGFVSVSGRPLADAYVHVMFPERNDVTSRGYHTDEDGWFRASELAEGTARIRADLELGDGLFHHSSIFTDVEVAENMLSTVTLEFPETSIVLTGTVLYNGRPVPYLGVNLNIESSDGTRYHYQVPVDSDGSYTVYDIVPGTGKFQLLRQVSESGYSGSPTAISIDLGGSRRTEHDVILQGPELDGAEYENPWRASNEAFWNAWLASVRDHTSE